MFSKQEKLNFRFRAMDNLPQHLRSKLIFQVYQLEYSMKSVYYFK